MTQERDEKAAQLSAVLDGLGYLAGTDDK